MALVTSPPRPDLSVCIPVTMAPVIAVLLTAVYFTFALGESCSVITQQLSDPPYENYFHSDCNTDAQVVVTSPLPDSNLSIICPRLSLRGLRGTAEYALSLNLRTRKTERWLLSSSTRPLDPRLASSIAMKKIRNTHLLGLRVFSLSTLLQN